MKSLSSVQSQSYTNLEIIIIDDCSKLDIKSQIIKLKEGGYNSVFSFEPFSKKIHNMPDPTNEIN